MTQSKYKRMTYEELLGMRVRLLKTLRNQRGQVFYKGSVMVIDNKYRGFTLLQRSRNGNKAISRVAPESVELLT